MLRRLSRSTEFRALLTAAGSFGIFALLLFSQTIPARSAPESRVVAQAIEPQAGDSERGQALFMGQAHFENDGPPCMACHNISGSGLLGGGAMGPDLTDAAAWYGEADLASSLANISWPTMKPIYSEHPLTPAEQADLSAFLLSHRESQQNNYALVVMGIGLLGCIAAAGFFGFMYRRRLRGVRQALVSQARLPRRVK